MTRSLCTAVSLQKVQWKPLNTCNLWMRQRQKSRLILNRSLENGKALRIERRLLGKTCHPRSELGKKNTEEYKWSIISGALAEVHHVV